MPKNISTNSKVRATAKDTQAIRVRSIDAIDAVAAADWNALCTDRYPFIRHEFLHALETTGCANLDTGWQPQHIICETESGQLVGAMPLYRKTNSYGEFVFDFSWANAYHQAGLPYYPKLVSAIPFTPATGPRLLAGETDDAPRIQRTLVDGAIGFAKSNQLSSIHILFPNVDDITLLRRMGLSIRKDCQFHWHNHDYPDFDAFLETFTARKRKKVRRERRRMREHGIRFEVRHGGELSADDWAEIMPLYRHTFLRRGREPYLGQEFMLEISATMPDSTVVFMGRAKSELVSVAICFRSDTALYGRYWGANQFFDSLHFETCYYQGIDYCIEHGLRLFEPGTQGEHKISRGFVPTETWSAHWLLHAKFAAAVNEFLGRERSYIDEYIDAAENHAPYRQSDGNN